jgi:hypothetical protein
MRSIRSFILAGGVLAVSCAGASAQIIEDWSSGTDANWFRVDFLNNPPGPLPLGGTSYTVADGRYTLASNQPLPPLPVQLGAASLFNASLVDPGFSNGVMRTVVRFNADNSGAFLIARANLVEGDYYGLIFGASAQGGLLNINRVSDFVNAAPIASVMIPALAVGQDYNVEFSFSGPQLAGKLWAVGDPEPALPLVTATDSMYVVGGIGVAISTLAGQMGPISASYGAVAFVPGPAGGLALVGAGVLAATRRRRAV